MSEDGEFAPKVAPVLILTGPSGAGKNTIATIMARVAPRCAVVDFDQVRGMFAHPRRAPWQGDEGHSQQLLGAEIMVGIAGRFAAQGWSTVLLETLSDETAGLYRRGLSEAGTTIVRLLPAWSEVMRRFRERERREGRRRLTDEEIRLVYDGQVALREFDVSLDTTAASPEAAAAELMGIWSRGER